MSKFKKASGNVQPKNVEAFINGAENRAAVFVSSNNRQTIPKISFLLKLEQDVHDLLKGIAEVEDRSMQWMLRKMTEEAIRRKAQELNIGN